jgi:antiviral helicase SLH1
MSPAVEDAQAQWLEQLDAMRKAIAELKLPADAGKAPAYGDDLEFDDDDFSGTASGEDIWDIISDEYEEEYSSDHIDQVQDSQFGGNAYSQDWLTQKCSDVARNSSGLDAGALRDQITAILSSDSNGEILSKWTWNSILTKDRRGVADDARRHCGLWGIRLGGRPHLPPKRHHALPA